MITTNVLIEKVARCIRVMETATSGCCKDIRISHCAADGFQVSPAKTAQQKFTCAPRSELQELESVQVFMTRNGFAIAFEE